jgi:ABC-type antimicrobial peptide transport system permease subunit
MKTCALYGFIIALADSLLVLILFFLGWHSDPAKLTAAKWVGGLAALLIGVSLTFLGVKARRSEVPESESFGYGSALWAGVRISFVACFLTAIFNYAYSAFINPGFADIIIQDQMDKMAAKGISGDQADKVEKFMHFLMSPAVYSIYTMVLGFIFALVISLIVAAFLKRAEPVDGAPPPVRA